jgi:guanylate kinase
MEQAAERGVHVVLDVDVQGARQLKESVPDIKLIFVLPPDVDTLLSRLTGRGTEDPAEVARRLQSALEELQAVENFDYVVVNDDLERCLKAIRGIVSNTVQAMGPEAVEHDVEAFRSAIRRILVDDFSEYVNVS